MRLHEVEFVSQNATVKRWLKRKVLSQTSNLSRAEEGTIYMEDAKQSGTKLPFTCSIPLRKRELRHALLER